MEKRSLHVLVVDDDKAIMEIIPQFIKKTGNTVEVAGSCEDALLVMTEHDFDLAFIDVNLPDGSGIKLMEKTKELYPEINIVAMTGGASRDEEIQIRQQRVICFLVKPFLMSNVISIVSHVASRKGNDMSIDNVDLLRSA